MKNVSLGDRISITFSQKTYLLWILLLSIAIILYGLLKKLSDSQRNGEYQDLLRLLEKANQLM